MYISWNFQLVEWVFPHVKLIPFKSIHKWKYMTLLPQLFYTQFFFVRFQIVLFLWLFCLHTCLNFFILRNFSCALRGNVFHWGIFIFFMEIFSFCMEMWTFSYIFLNFFRFQKFQTFICEIFYFPRLILAFVY